MIGFVPRRLGHTDGDAQVVGCVRLDGHQIIFDYSHVMAVDGKHVARPRRPIDEAQDVLFFLREGCVEISAGAGHWVMAHPVDNQTVCPGEAASYLNIVANKSRVVHVVLNEYRAKVDVPIAARGTVNNEWAGQAVRVLSESQYWRRRQVRGVQKRKLYLERVVRMIPGMAILQGPVSIRERISFGNGTLGDAVDAVHLHCTQLSQPVPVDSSPVVSVVVLDMYDKLISPACLDQGSGVLFVEDLAVGLAEAICIDLGKVSTSAH